MVRRQKRRFFTDENAAAPKETMLRRISAMKIKTQQVRVAT